MGTVWYAVRRDRRDVFDLGKVGFWIADALGLSNDNPTPAIQSLDGLLDALAKAYGANADDVASRLSAFIAGSSDVVIADEQHVWDEYHDGTDNTPVEVDGYWRPSHLSTSTAR